MKKRIGLGVSFILISLLLVGVVSAVDYDFEVGIENINPHLNEIWYDIPGYIDGSDRVTVYWDDDGNSCSSRICVNDDTLCTNYKDVPNNNDDEKMNFDPEITVSRVGVNGEKIDGCRDTGYTDFNSLTVRATGPVCFHTNGGVEICDGIDNNCNRQKDEGGVCPIGPYSSGLYDNLISYWTMDVDDDSDATTAVDVWGDNDGVVTEATQVDSDFEEAEQAYEFDGTNSFINCGKNLPATGPVTISVWIKFTDLVNPGYFVGRYDVRDDPGAGSPSGDEGYVLFTHGEGKIRSFSTDRSRDATISTDSSYDGAWHHVVGVFSSEQTQIFIDGEEEIVTGEGKDFDIFWADFLIGAADSIPGEPVRIYKGLIDEVGVWGRLLEDDEIADLFEYSFEIPPICGNGIIEATEECDDGDLVSGDGCSDICLIESDLGWSCYDEPSSCCLINEICSETEIFCNEGVFSERPCEIDPVTGCNDYVGDLIEIRDCFDEGLLCSVGGCYSEGTSAPSFCQDFLEEPSCNDAPQVICDNSVNEFLNEQLVEKVAYVESQLPEEGFCETGFPLYPADLNASELGYSDYGLCNYFAVNCSCEWDSDSEDGCFASYEVQVKCDEEVVVDTGKCKLSSVDVDNKCDTEGVIVYTRSATWTGDFEAPGICDEETYEKTYPCVDTAQLPFFTGFNLIISLTIISLIYAFIIARKK
jgi:cysteine-rich repeat protein